MNKSYIETISQAAWTELKQARRVLVGTHENPDGDAISSVCVLIELLEKLKIDYYAFCPGAAPANFSFLPHFEKVKDRPDQSGRIYSHLILADCAVVSRSRLDESYFQRCGQPVIVNFDHHPRTESIVDFDIRDDKAASTTEVIYLFLKTNNFPISRPAANALLTGILTDTANFFYPSTSSRSLRIAAELLSLGARYPKILESSWKNKSLPSMRIWGEALAGLRINLKYNLAYSVLTEKENNYLQVAESELDGISGFLSNLYGVKGVIFLRDDGQGEVKGSLRTADQRIDISRLARQLGGGGHAKASGFKIKGSLEKDSHGKWKIV